MRKFATIGAAVFLAGALVSVALADSSPTPAVPFVMPYGKKDVSLVPSGIYTLDTNHVGIIARVSHLDFSISIFRFDRANATLEWNRDAPEKSKLKASVETGSIATNVAGFAAQLSGPQYLNAAAYPQATYVSTAFHQTDATHGTVDGDFTLLGKTKRVTFDVTLIGAGPGFAGGPVMGHVIGIEAKTAINPQDYGLPPLFKAPIEIVIDTEFDKKPS
jgi:polyisoprenoid-binding protein YceI